MFGDHYFKKIDSAPCCVAKTLGGAKDTATNESTITKLPRFSHMPGSMGKDPFQTHNSLA